MLHREDNNFTTIPITVLQHAHAHTHTHSHASSFMIMIGVSYRGGGWDFPLSEQLSFQSLRLRYSVLPT